MHILIYLFLLLNISACDLYKPQDPAKPKISTDNNNKSKEVTVYNFTKIKSESFNFNTIIPDSIAVSNNIIYLTKLETNNLFSWHESDGNIDKAWKKHNLVAPHVINKIASIKEGIVAITFDPTPGNSFARIYEGQTENEKMSIDFGIAIVLLKDVKEIVSSNGQRGVYFTFDEDDTLVAGQVNNYVSWLNFTDISAGFRYSLKYQNGNLIAATNNNITSLEMLPDGKILLARNDGFFHIEKIFSEQIIEASSTDPDDRKEEFKNKAGTSPASINLVRMVGDYLIVALENSGIRWAKLDGLKYRLTEAEEISGLNIKNIVNAQKNEAYLIADKKIVKFIDGEVEEFLSSDKLISHRANIKREAKKDPISFDNFKGGNLGTSSDADIPSNGSTFSDLAFKDNKIWLLTSDGFYTVKTSKEKKVFTE